MANIIDYVEWRGDLNLNKTEFNEIDSLILNRFSYFPLDNLINKNEMVSIKELSERFKKADKKQMRILWKDDADLFPIMGNSKRFGEMLALEYINKIDPEQEKQFSAITVILPDDTLYISYRGTDNTLIGWKEDFNISFKSHIASQISAKKYLENIAKKYPYKKIRIGGHSKGGNLAVYASVFVDSEIQKRIINVYNNDGPGFDSDFVKHPDYLAILPKIKSIVPYGSVVGMLLNHDGDYEVVKSSQSGLMQHDSMSWQVIGPDFETEQELSPKSKRLNAALSAWIDGLTREQRAEFVDTLFSLVTASGAKNLSEISTARFKNINAILKSFRELDKSERAMILKIFASLTGEIGKAYKSN